MFLLLHVGVTLFLHNDSIPRVFSNMKTGKIYGKGQTVEGCLTCWSSKDVP